MKSCTICKEVKSEVDFYSNNNKRSKLASECKKCSNVKTKKWISKNKESVNKGQLKRKCQRRESGQCSHCFEKALDKNFLCERHWFQDISRKHFKTVKEWQLLKCLWEKQDKKCIYSDEILIPGTNMSLDHIVSRFDNPLLSEDLTNIQWVTKDINQIKNKLSHNDFISLCCKIANKFKNTEGHSEIKACGESSIGVGDRNVAC